MDPLLCVCVFQDLRRRPIWSRNPLPVNWEVLKGQCCVAPHASSSVSGWYERVGENLVPTAFGRRLQQPAGTTAPSIPVKLPHPLPQLTVVQRSGTFVLFLTQRVREPAPCERAKRSGCWQQSGPWTGVLSCPAASVHPHPE